MNHKAPIHIDHDQIRKGSQLDSCEGLIRIDAGAIADAHLGVLNEATIVLNRQNTRLRVVCCDRTDSLDLGSLPPMDHHFALPRHMLMPGLVNAHTHLDLTHIGIHPHEPGDGFVSWVDMIRSNRHVDDAEVTKSVRLGISKLLAGGTSAVGDIAGAPNGRITLAPVHALCESALAGVSYLEFFGIGKTTERTRDRLMRFFDEEYPEIARSLEPSTVRVGLQPHAPNTVDLSIYQMVADRAHKLGIPVSTHLAETQEENEFIRTGSGSQRTLLERLGVWDDAILDHIARGNHPVEHLHHALAATPFLVAHVNDATDEAIETLAKTSTSVAYCPRASAYFGAQCHFGPHRYAEMLEAGICVCLGTDSIVNLDTPDRVSVLDEMRLLHRRDAADPTRLLQMGTVNGAVALRLEVGAFTLSADSTPRGLLCVPIGSSGIDPWSDVMESALAPSWVFAPEKTTC